MRLIALALAALLAAAVALPAVAGEAPDSGPEPPLVRMRDGHGSDLLFRVDPRTLQQVGRPIRTFRGGSDLSITPTGNRLAFADGSRRGARIHFVDLERWRSMGVAHVGRHGWLTVGWVSEDRVVAIVDQGLERQRLLWVDARTRKVVARRPFAGWTAGKLAVPGGMALALGPREGVGPLRLLLLDPDGGVRAITLEGIQAGADYDEPGGRVLTPAVVADPDGARVLVVAARGLRVAEVDLASGGVRYHTLGASAAKENVGVWWRHAVWAGDGRIAVTGDHWPPVRGRRAPDGPVPFGVRLIDTHAWTISTLDPRPDSIHAAGGTVLAAGTRWFDAGERSTSTGLLAFDASGRRAFTRFRRQPVALLGSRGRLAYVWVRRDRRAHVIDLDTGRTVDMIRTGPRAPSLLSPP